MSKKQDGLMGSNYYTLNRRMVCEIHTFWLKSI
jgi:hypothetical protein